MRVIALIAAIGIECTKYTEITNAIDMGIQS